MALVNLRHGLEPLLFKDPNETWGFKSGLEINFFVIPLPNLECVKGLGHSLA